MVMWAWLLLLCTLGMLLLPLLPALHELVFKTDVQPLPIEHALRGEVGYFAASFGGRVRQWLEEGAHPAPGLTRLADAAPTASAFEALGPDVAAVALLGDAVRLPPALSLDRELYAAGEVQVGAGSRLRAVLAEGLLGCADGVVVQRWADADSVVTGRHCCFHGRVSARQRIEFGEGTVFERVSAPVIVAATRPAPAAARGAAGGVSGDAASAGAQVVPGPMPAPDVAHPLAGRHTYWRDLRPLHPVAHRGDLVVQGDAALAAGSRVRGSIKTHRDLDLQRGCVVHGHLVARGVIRLGPQTRVRGNLMSETHIHLGEGSVVGTPEQPVSISAPQITLAPGATVHGSLSAYEGGRVA